MRGHLALLALGLATACTDPTIEVQLVFPDAGAGSLAEAVERYDLAVVVANADCAAARYLELSDEDLRRGTRVFIHDQPVDVPAILTDVPRVDAKLFVVTGYDAAGAVIAGGCADVRDPIEADRRIPIPMEPALITRVVNSEAVTPSLTLPGTDGFELLARERRRDGAPVNQAALRFALRTSVGDLALVTSSAPPGFRVDTVSEPDGVFAIRGLDSLPLDQLSATTSPAGPAELVIRGAWSDEVNRIPISFDVAPVEAWLDAARAPNRIAPAWTTLPCSGVDNPCTDGAALFQGASGPPHVVAFRARRPAPPETLLTITLVPGPDVPDARTLVAFRRPLRDESLLVTRTTSGWTTLKLTMTGWVVATGDEVTAAADQLLALPRCGGPSLGLLAVAGTNVQGYADVTPAVALDTDPIGRLAAALRGWLASGEQLELLGAACVQARGTAAQPAIAVRRTRADGERVTLLVSAGGDPPLVVDTDMVGAVTAAALGDVPTVIATSPEANTLRVRSSRLMLATAAPRLVPDGIISHPVPAVPTALTTLDANRDGLDDTAALVPLGAGVGLAMTLGGARVDDALSATHALRTPMRGRRLAPLGKPGEHQALLVLGDDSLAVYDFTPPRP